MNHQERRQQQRQAQRSLVSSSRAPVTVHCRIENQHIPLGEALAKHDPNSAHCFSCGQGGDKCRKQAGITTPDRR